MWICSKINSSKLSASFSKGSSTLKTASNLEILELKEINTKIKAEAFDFLLDMPKLKQMDFQYIDFNKKRIEIMRKKWIDSGKQDILIDCISKEKRQRKMNSIHLSRILM